VLDLPSSTESFIASRTFGSDPEQVSGTGTAFADGLQRQGVAATAKHFPGLGAAVVNTDEAPSTIDASRAELADGLEPFRAAIQRQVALTMVSNATYAAYDESRPASQSRRVIEGLLRRKLGFEGVVITDDLGAGALAGAGIGEAEAAVGAAAAGADLLLFALSDGSQARAALLRALRGGELDRAGLVESCERVRALRARFAG
jgi:beta-N-acetylhexosaminidase